MIWRLTSYFFLVALGTAAVLFFRNPQLQALAARGRHWTDKPAVYPSWNFGRTEPRADGPSSYFRGDARRRAWISDALGIDLSLRGVVPAVNVGIHSASKSSPAVSGALIVTGSDGGFLRAYHEDGSLKWTLRSLVATFGFHATPVIADGVVYVGDYAGLFYAVELATGDLKWILPVGDGVGATALAHGRYLYINVEMNRPDGFLLKVERSSGKVIWRSAFFGEQSHSSPALDEGRGLLVLGDNAGWINILSVNDGSFIRRIKTGGALKGTPALGDKFAYISNWDKNLFAVDLDNFEVAWTLPLAAGNQSSVALSDVGQTGWINSAAGICRFDARAGAFIKCEHRPSSRFSRMGSPVVSRRAARGPGELVWSPCDVQNLCVYESRTGNRLRTWDLGAPLSGEPVIYAGRVWLITRGQGGLIVLESEKGG